VVEPQRRPGQPVQRLTKRSVPVVDHITGTVDLLAECNILIAENETKETKRWKRNDDARPIFLLTEVVHFRHHGLTCG
jgi:hypothetical protein